MTLRSRLIALAVTAGVFTALVGCGPDEIKEPKLPSDAKKLEPKPANGGGPAGGGAGGKPGQGAQ